MKSAPSAGESSPGTTAYWESSPSPVSPATRKLTSSPSARRTMKSSSEPALRARSRASWTQRMRAASTGSWKRRAMMSLRERHSVAGRSQDSGLASEGTLAFQLPQPEHCSQPAPATEVREFVVVTGRRYLNRVRARTGRRSSERGGRGARQLERRPDDPGGARGHELLAAPDPPAHADAGEPVGARGDHVEGAVAHHHGPDRPERLERRGQRARLGLADGVHGGRGHRLEAVAQAEAREDRLGERP